MPDKIICVVDDDLSIRRAVSRLLGAYSLPVETYTSAEAFLDASHPNGVACVILDICMDGMSGFDLYDRLRAAECCAPPVIFLTGCDDVATRDRIARCEAIAYIQKPFVMRTLLSAVGRAIGRDLDRPLA